jgi:hypothetical protein
MFERAADGLIGLFIFFSNWFSPGENSEEIKIAAASEFSRGYTIECVIKIHWNEQMSDLIDAGIPLRFMITSWSDVGDSAAFIRTLQCDISTYTYAFSDSIRTPERDKDSVYVSKEYSQVYRAVKRCCTWTCAFSKEAKKFYMLAELLPGWVSQLNRSVDMSEICGRHTYSRSLVKKE